MGTIEDIWVAVGQGAIKSKVDTELWAYGFYEVFRSECYSMLEAAYCIGQLTQYAHSINSDLYIRLYPLEGDLDVLKNLLDREITRYKSLGMRIEYGKKDH